MAHSPRRPTSNASTQREDRLPRTRRFGLAPRSGFLTRPRTTSTVWSEDARAKWLLLFCQRQCARTISCLWSEEVFFPLAPPRAPLQGYAFNRGYASGNGVAPGGGVPLPSRT